METMNVINAHDNMMAERVPEQTAVLGREISDYLHNEGEKGISEQHAGQLSNTIQPAIPLNSSNSTEVITAESEEIPKKLLRKIKKKKSQNSKQIKKWFKGKTDKLDHGENLSDVTQRENSQDEHPVSLHIQPISRGDSCLNSSILEEILSEKKRILLESTKMIEFLQSRIRT